MALFNLNADFNSVQATSDFDVLPPGEYRAMIVDSDIKPTKSGGEMAVLQFSVIDAPHENRRVFENLNINCPTSKKAEEIAMSTLKSICEAIGLNQFPQDTVALHNKPMIIKLKIETSAQYGDSNRVVSIKPVNGAPTLTPTSVAQAAEMPAPTIAAQQSANVPPWAQQ